MHRRRPFSSRRTRRQVKKESRRPRPSRHPRSTLRQRALHLRRTHRHRRQRAPQHLLPHTRRQHLHVRQHHPLPPRSLLIRRQHNSHGPPLRLRPPRRSKPLLRMLLQQSSLPLRLPASGRRPLHRHRPIRRPARSNCLRRRMPRQRPPRVLLLPALQHQQDTRPRMRNQRRLSRPPHTVDALARPGRRLKPLPVRNPSSPAQGRHSQTLPLRVNRPRPASVPALPARHLRPLPVDKRRSRRAERVAPYGRRHRSPLRCRRHRRSPPSRFQPMLHRRALRCESTRSAASERR